MKKIGIFTLILLLLASIFVSGCASDDLTELNIGYQPSTHQIAYMTAAEKGWWQEDLAPYGIEKINEYQFPTGAPEMQAMMSGDLDVAYVGAAPVVAALSEGLDAKIVTPVQINGSSLVLRPEHEYESPEDLKGLTIATFPPGTIQDTLLKNWLRENGLDAEKDVRILGMTPGDAVTAISAKRVDAVFLPHPSPTVIEREGNGRTIVQSGEMEANHSCCVLVVSGKLIREHPEIVEQIVRTHIKATEYNQANVDEAAQIYSNKTTENLETVKTSLEEWDGEWITDPALIESSAVNYSNTQYELGIIPKSLTKEDIFDTSFYEKVMSEKQAQEQE
ncbi:NitT/TauT family transport system substrate-binding protein [Methanosarcina thermophila]|uniref:ABC-type nitrate/sulfonate/bicarbonate transport systems, periplasmic components n=2 Tax=Methanosarcina thermophila TaxID=2210 RepID=A0A1I6ZIT9_METTE|nr:ABC transporter substrate-binding protein [Methanosarcina thermophila]ALK04902.1 MAG: sulfonate ABC transporter substrate-binding protein [Methanosarcina sp. 795]AKB13620.1 ABC-type nitrate/sulfonate/bicarbonate transport systems, periplasmic component [Methanosarcina thermophila TM-1]NLU58040.1 ABC transporter substrate-binding protein [Methanosarcina thermophila]SFT62533.1 NitT/TauT family transport system substrate-binding protein [Methanosarcina thermophila]BAW28629.1 ABC-type nitrate/s